MHINKVLNLLIYATIILSIIIIVIFTRELFTIERELQTPIPPPPPIEFPPGEAKIMLKYLGENITDEYLEINESLLEQNQLLADVFDAWYNPEDYENAEYGDNNVYLFFTARSSEVHNLTRFLEDKFLEKYPTYTGPLYLYYNQQFFYYMPFY